MSPPVPLAWAEHDVPSCVTFSQLVHLSAAAKVRIPALPSHLSSGEKGFVEAVCLFCRPFGVSTKYFDVPVRGLEPSDRFCGLGLWLLRKHKDVCDF